MADCSGILTKGKVLFKLLVESINKFMMTIITLLIAGLELVQQAVARDHNGDYKGALHFYSSALESFVSVLKYEKNERVKATLKAKVQYK